MKHPKELTKKQLEAMVEALICRLYEDEYDEFNPDKDWDSDMMGDLAKLLAKYNLVPEEYPPSTMIELRKKAKRPIRKVFAHCATVHHRHGIDTYVAPTKKSLYTMLYKYVKDWWGEWDILDEDGNEEELPDNHKEAVERYFEVAHEEYWDYSTTHIQIEE